MASPVNIVQALIARIGKGLGYDAGNVVVSHGGTGEDTVRTPAMLLLLACARCRKTRLDFEEVRISRHASGLGKIS